jgi:hypothetical protein
MGKVPEAGAEAEQRCGFDSDLETSISYHPDVGFISRRRDFGPLWESGQVRRS